ncbi:MAG: hypothetical protein ACLVJ6_02945 [Merdibacter sp.]
MVVLTAAASSRSRAGRIYDEPKNAFVADFIGEITFSPASCAPTA